MGILGRIFGGKKKEGQRLSAQDQPRLDAEIEAWAASIDGEDVERWIGNDSDRMAWQRARAEDLPSAFDETFDEIVSLYHPEKDYQSFQLNYRTPRGSLKRIPEGASIVLKAAGCEAPVGVERTVEYWRDFYNDLYLTRGKLRKMKEIYKPAIEKVEETIRRHKEERERAEKLREVLWKEAQKFLAQDRARLDAEIEAWAASIDKRKVRRWIVEDLEKRCKVARQPHTGFYVGIRHVPRYVPKISFTPKALRESKFEDDYLGHIVVTFVSEANREYQVFHICKDYDLHLRKGLSFEGPAVVLEQKQSGRIDKEDYTRVGEVATREIGHEFEKIHYTNYVILGKINLKDNPTQSRVADYVERYEKHFRDVKIITVWFKDIPEKGYLREYAEDRFAREFLFAFDSVSHHLGVEEGEYWAEDPPVPYLPKGVGEARWSQSWLRIHDPLYYELSPELKEHVDPLVDYHVAARSLRKMKEMYREVMAEMGLIEPACPWRCPNCGAQCAGAEGHPGEHKCSSERCEVRKRRY